VTRPRTGFPYLDEGVDRGEVLAFAHRGGARHPDLVGLENTLTAFRHAVGLGYRYLETDVHATSDGVLLAFHDDVLDRVTDTAGLLSRLTYAEVAKARIGALDAVPTLEQLFEELPSARFNIDIKHEAAVEPLAELIARTGRQDAVCVGSFSGHSIARFRRVAGPRVATSCATGAVVVRRFVPVTGRSWPHGAVLQVPHRYRALGRSLRIITAGFVRRAHAKGLPVHAWTIDDRDKMNELLDLGVDGIFTDRTDVLRDVLVARGQWRETDR